MNHDSIQNTADLRSLNKKKILDSLRFRGPQTKRDIADDTELSFATVSSLANQMEAEGLVQYAGVYSSNGGRTPVLLDIRTDVYYLLAINFAIANEIRMALLSLSGQRMYEWECGYSSGSPYYEVIAHVTEGLNKLLEDASIGLDRILQGVAAVPGIFDHHSCTIINSTIPLYENMLMVEDLKKLLKMDIFVENEANLMALACLSNDFDRERVNDLVFLYIGEGLGIGVVSNGALLTGSHGFGGEISHIPLGRDGYECYCGNRNCVETELSIMGFIRKYNDRQTKKQIDSSKTLQTQWEDFVQFCFDRDETAMTVVNENGILLGALTATLANLFDPMKVIIGGYVDQVADFLLPNVQREMLSRRVDLRQEAVPVRFAAGYNRLIMSGCGELAFAKWNP